jgi:hypothetical protein
MTRSDALEERAMTMTPPNWTRRRQLAAAIVALLVAGCGDGSPTAPSAFPQVAGTPEPTLDNSR